MVPSRSTATSAGVLATGFDVAAVVLATGFDVAADTIADRVHPNAAGADKIARRWAEALTPWLR